MRVLMSLVLLAGCGQGPSESDGPPEAVPEVVAEPLPVERHLLRASMALVGRRPSADELDRVLADPGALADVVDEYLDSPAFGVTVRDMHDEWWLLESSVGALPIVGLDPVADPAKMYRELPMQSLALIERVVMEDMPYDEILLADWTMGNRLTTSAWVGITEMSEEFTPTQWNDGRPEAGILSDSWMYAAYRSAPGNHNRRRANAISRALLCLDFLAGIPIPEPGLDLNDPGQVTDAVRNDPNCTVCHNTLDPLASFLAMRPYPVLTEETWPISMYHPEYEGMWQDVDGLPPAYFGEPGSNVDDLARFIAEDPLFPQCTARRAVSYLEQRPLESVDVDRVHGLTDVFQTEGLDFKALVRSIVLSEPFADMSDAGPGPQVLRPEHLGPLYDDLVGFTWSSESTTQCCGNKFGSRAYGHVPDLSRDAFVGHRLLLGGVDAPNVTLPVHASTPTTLVTLRGFARVAANHEVEQYLAGEPRLLTLLGSDPADPDAVRAQAVALHRRLYTELLPEGDVEIDATVALFDDLHAQLGDPAEAWEMVLWAMFQDFRMVTY